MPSMASATLLVGLSNTIHIIATVIWLGWSLLLVLATNTATPAALLSEQQNWPTLVLHRAPLAYLALALLSGSGLYQMAASPFYVDFLTLTNLWSQLLFVKHLAMLVSLALMAYLAASLLPELRLESLALTRGKGNPARPAALARRLAWLAWLNLAANGVVVLTTGLMTAIREG
jgi:uncharacterized membrane protein